MSDIYTIIEEAQLMMQNRADLVKTINGLGFHQVNAETPLSDIARYMQWAGGLLDLRLACFSKKDRKQHFFSREEWEALSAFNKSSYIKMGICIRAECQQFIIAKDNQISPTGTNTMIWADNVNNDVRGLTNFNGISALLADIDGEANTDLILAAVKDNGINYPAAQQARAYKASTLADEGVEDKTVWSLPAIGQAWLFYKYMHQINAEFDYHGMQPLNNNSYWSSTEANSFHAWYVNLYNGAIRNIGKNSTATVRPIAPVLS